MRDILFLSFACSILTDWIGRGRGGRGVCVSLFSVTVLLVWMSADWEGERAGHLNYLRNHHLFFID